MELTDLRDLGEKRRALRPLLSPTDPADALASYYALWHDPRRVQITLHQGPQGRVDGFLVVAQTGADLFRQLVTLRADRDTVVSSLLRQALQPGRPYRVVAPVALASALRSDLEFDRTSLSWIYMVDPSRFEPVINVLVQQVPAADGFPRFQIQSGEQVVAMSGTNWRSANFAEVFVYVHPQGRGRGWGRSVVSACTVSLLEKRLRPLYMVEEGNEGSMRLAESLGYVDTGKHEFSGEGQLR
jgi:ribosomal protein S18 acetylase RimI-like enzyme